jgi:hypothetical protein
LEVVATLVVLAWWAVLAPAFVGLGSLVVGRHFGPGVRLFIGLALAVAFLQVWHFFHAVDTLATGVVLAMGSGGLALAAKRGWLSRPLVSLPGAMVWAAGILWLANRSTGPCQMFDSLIYQLHHVEWIRTLPIVPGLGNLNDRLGFNNSSFLLAALMEPSRLAGHGSHFLNGLLVAGVWSLLVKCLDELIGGRRLTLADAFLLVLSYPLLNDASHYRISSLGADSPAFVFMALGAWALLRQSAATGDGRWPFVALLMAAAAACIKITAAPFSALLFGLVFLRWLRSADGARLRHYCAATAIGVLFIVPWMGRGIVESGYPFYPMPVLRADVDWAVPIEMAKMTQVNNERAARTFNFRLEFGREPEPDTWFRGWLLRQWRYGKADLVVPAVLLLIGVPLAASRRALSRLTRDVLTAVGIGVVVWFIVGPQPRYGSGLIWIGAAVVVGGLLSVSSMRQQRLAAVGWIGFGMATLLGPLLFRAGLVGSQQAPMAGLIIPAAERGLFHQPVRTSVMQRFRTGSGLELDVPIQGEGGWRLAVISDSMVIGQPLINNACFPGPLLRTPFPDPALTLRDPRSIAGGFRRVPAPGQSALLESLR